MQPFGELGEAGSWHYVLVRQYFVYILASKSHRLYIGVTNNLARRLFEHRSGWSYFTSRYRINRLVYHETRPHPMQAIRREKAIKRMSRAEKTTLIEAANPKWKDLAADWFDPPDTQYTEPRTADSPAALPPGNDYSPS